MATAVDGFVESSSHHQDTKARTCSGLFHICRCARTGAASASGAKSALYTRCSNGAGFGLVVGIVEWDTEAIPGDRIADPRYLQAPQPAGSASPGKVEVATPLPASVPTA